MPLITWRCTVNNSTGRKALDAALNILLAIGVVFAAFIAAIFGLSKNS